MRIHIFVDAENINPKLFELSYAELKIKHEIICVDIFGKEAVLPNIYSKYNDKKFRITKCFYGKNSADTFMTASIIKSLYEEILTDGFVIFTQDKDFAPAIKTVTDNNKQVILITEKDRIMNNLKAVGVNMTYFKAIEYEIPIAKISPYKKIEIPKKQYKHLEEYDISKTIFIKGANNKIIETFFNNGMSFDVFLNTLTKVNIDKIKKGYSSRTKLTDILKKSYLVVKNDKIYCDIDKILEEESL